MEEWEQRIDNIHSENRANNGSERKVKCRN